MITRRGGALLVAAVALWGVGRYFGVPELYIVAAATASLVAVAFIAVRAGTSTVSIRRGVTSDRILHGGSTEATLHLRNDARLPAGMLLLEDSVPRLLAESPRFVVPGLGPGRTTAVSYRLTGTTRGRYRVGPAGIRVRDPFGLVQRVRRYSATDEVLVYPEVERLRPLGTPGSHHGSGNSTVRRLFSTGDEFYTMREYLTGDDLRMVHWPSTAHRQTLMVRQQEQPWQAEATVLCDNRHAAHSDVSPLGSFEKAISVAASALWHLADHHYSVRLVVPGDSGRTKGRAETWQQALDRLAEMKPSRVASLVGTLEWLRMGAEGLLVAVIGAPPGHDSPAEHRDIQTLLSVGRRFGGRVAIVVAPSSGRPGARAEATAALLRAAGWRATTAAPGEPLADRWASLALRRTSGTGAAT